MVFRLFSSPLFGPLKFAARPGSGFQAAIGAQLNETEAMAAESAVFHRRLDLGQLSDEEFEALELGIVRRLQATARRMAAANAVA